MRKITAAVVGVGYLGRFHAQKYAQAAECELVGVADARQDAREAVAAEVGTRAVADYRELLGAVEAVSVVTPTPAHYSIARDFLESGLAHGWLGYWAVAVGPALLLLVARLWFALLRRLPRD